MHTMIVEAYCTPYDGDWVIRKCDDLGWLYWMGGFQWATTRYHAKLFVSEAEALAAYAQASLIS